MPAQFARIFGTDEEQYLATLEADDDNDGLVVRISFMPEGLGICSLGFGKFKSDEAARAEFDALTEEKITTQLKPAFDALRREAGINSI